MSVEPDTGVLPLDAINDESPTDRAAAPTERPQPRHARPRTARRRWSAAHVVAAGLAVALVVSVGIAGDLSRQLDQARAEQIAASAHSVELADTLERTSLEVGRLRDEVSVATTRASEAGQDLSALRDELAAADAATADAKAQLESTTSALADLRGRAEALASSILGSVDPVEACRQAAARVAEESVRARRSTIVDLARQAADACEAASGAVQESMPRASAVLSGE